jgi:carbamoylphosphate synthase large subunit
MNNNTYYFDKKTIIGWLIILLVPFLTLSSSRVFTVIDKQEINRDMVIRHDIRIRDLEENQILINESINKRMSKIEENSQETHDNVLILLTRAKLKPIKKNNQ